MHDLADRPNGVYSDAGRPSNVPVGTEEARTVAAAKGHGFIVMSAVIRRSLLAAVAVLVVCGSAVGVLAWAGLVRVGSEAPSAAPATATGEVASLGYVDGEHGVAALDSLRPARVEAVLVKENDTVAAGTVLVRLENRLARGRLEEARAALDIARLAVEQVQRRPEEHRLRLAQQNATLKAAQKRLAAARQRSNYRRKLFETNLEAPEPSAEAAAHVAELEALCQAELDRLNELKLVDPSLERKRTEVEVRVQEARVQQAEAELHELTLTAPQAGRILRILVRPGDLVGGPTHKPVVYFCPDGPRLVRVEVEQEFAGLLRPGQDAEIRDDAANEATWHGRVRRVADWFGPQRVVLDEPRPEREIRTVECVIEVQTGDAPLRIGQRVRVRIRVGPSSRERPSS